MKATKFNENVVLPEVGISTFEMDQHQLNSEELPRISEIQTSNGLSALEEKEPQVPHGIGISHDDPIHLCDDMTTHDSTGGAPHTGQ